MHAASLESSGARFGTSPTAGTAFELTLKALLQFFGIHAECCPVTSLNVASQHVVNHSQTPEFETAGINEV